MPWRVSSGRLAAWTTSQHCISRRGRGRHSARHVAQAQRHLALVEDGDDRRLGQFERPPGNQLVTGSRVAGLQRQESQRHAAASRANHSPAAGSARPIGRPLAPGPWGRLPADRRPAGQTADGPRARRSRGPGPIDGVPDAARAARGSSAAGIARGCRGAARNARAPLPLVGGHGDAEGRGDRGGVHRRAGHAGRIQEFGGHGIQAGREFFAGQFESMESEGSGVRVQGLGFRVQGFGLWFSPAACGRREQHTGYRVLGTEYRANAKAIPSREYTYVYYSSLPPRCKPPDRATYGSALGRVELGDMPGVKNAGQAAGAVNAEPRTLNT